MPLLACIILFGSSQISVNFASLGRTFPVNQESPLPILPILLGPGIKAPTSRFQVYVLYFIITNNNSTFSSIFHSVSPHSIFSINEVFDMPLIAWEPCCTSSHSIHITAMKTWRLQSMSPLPYLFHLSRTVATRVTKDNN